MLFSKVVSSFKLTPQIFLREMSNKIDDGPIADSEGRLRIPKSVIEGPCMQQIATMGMCKDQGNTCKREVQEMKTCMEEAIYHYVAIRKQCKRQYGTWASCMNEQGSSGASESDANDACYSKRCLLDDCSQTKAFPVAEAARDAGIKPIDMPEARS